MMDLLEARLACLKLAKKHHGHGGDKATVDTVMDTAKKWSEFVIGAHGRESSGASKKGADEK